MLFAHLKADGTLVVRASEPIEEYALENWEKAHKTGKAKLVIELGKARSLEDLIKMVGSNIADFQKWYSEQGSKAVIPELNKSDEK